MSQVIGRAAFNLGSQREREAESDRFWDGASRKRTTMADEKGMTATDSESMPEGSSIHDEQKLKPEGESDFPRLNRTC